MRSKNISKYVLTMLAAILWCGSLSGQQQTPQRTPWHVSKVFIFTHEGQAGTGIASGIDVAVVPNGHNGVVEHMSARCVAPSVLAIIYGEILVSANPSNPGQSGTQGSPPREDTASHPLLFRTAYSGALNVYVASQQATLRVNAPIGRVTFQGDFFNPGSGSAAITCLLSISGYIEKQ
jgi:hypothetical protein